MATKSQQYQKLFRLYKDETGEKEVDNKAVAWADPNSCLGDVIDPNEGAAALTPGRGLRSLRA